MSQKQKIISALHRADIGGVPVDFRSLLARLAESELLLPRMDAEAFSDANLMRYWNWAQQENDAHVRRGCLPLLRAVSATSRAISSPIHAMISSHDPSQREVGKLAISRAKLLRAIDALTDREYEALACVACSAIGSKSNVLTRRGNEGGIDFFASISVSSGAHIFAAPGAELRIVGQCKKYSSQATVGQMDQFIQTLQNVRHRSSRVSAHIPAWFGDSRGPIVGWMISHAGFQTGASDQAKNHGIVTSDSLDVAEVLSLSPSFHSSLPPDGRASKIADECGLLLK